MKLEAALQSQAAGMWSCIPSAGHECQAHLMQGPCRSRALVTCITAVLCRSEVADAVDCFGGFRMLHETWHSQIDGSQVLSMVHSRTCQCMPVALCAPFCTRHT